MSQCNTSINFVQTAYDQVSVAIESVMLLPTIGVNTLIIVIVAKFHGMQRPDHILIANLSLSGLLMGAVCYPYDIWLVCFNLKKNHTTKPPSKFLSFFVPLCH